MVRMSRLRFRAPASSAAPRLAWLAGAALCVPLVGCSSITDGGSSLLRSMTPYQSEVVQGNFVSREQVGMLKPGLSRAQVRDLLGTPMLTSLFHADRWDYVFTLRRKGEPEQSRRLAVFFDGDKLARFEGDEMPSETEFVASLQSGRKLPKPPVLELSAEERDRLARPSTQAQGTGGGSESGPMPLSYPPLEAPRR